MKIAIATSVYEAARPYLASWIDGVMSAVPAQHSVEAVVAVHGFSEPELALAALDACIPIRIVPVAEQRSIAEVRGAMLRAAGQTEVDFVVFIDADDVLLPQALQLHAAALDGADCSFGDMILVDREGHGLGSTFFAGATVPETAARGALQDRNFMGFSNSAVRYGVLTGDATAVPAQLAAVDWWVFTKILAGGARARRTAGPVAQYRQHGRNTLGGSQASSLAQARKRCEIALVHYSALSSDASVNARKDALLRLIEDDNLLRQAMDRAPPHSGVWFEDVAAWIECIPAIELGSPGRGARTGGAFQ